MSDFNTKISYDATNNKIVEEADVDPEVTLRGFISFKRLCEEVLPKSGELRPREKVVGLEITERGVEMVIAFVD